MMRNEHFSFQSENSLPRSPQTFCIDLIKRWLVLSTNLVNFWAECYHKFGKSTIDVLTDLILFKLFREEIKIGSCWWSVLITIPYLFDCPILLTCSRFFLFLGEGGVNVSCPLCPCACVPVLTMQGSMDREPLIS